MAGLLSKDGVKVKEVTTDPDSGAGQAGESLLKGGLLASLLPVLITSILDICLKI